jgi:hypothetical protein
VDEGFRNVRTDLSSLSARLGQGLAGISEQIADGDGHTLAMLAELSQTVSTVNGQLAELKVRWQCGLRVCHPGCPG